MKTILLVEDDSRIQTAMGIRLKSMGYSVVSAVDAVYAMDQAVKARPDVVLLDINLPGGDGFLVAERLRKRNETVDTPIIFITASKREEFRVRAAMIGASGFLEKPFSATQLSEAIEKSLESSSDALH